MEEQYNITKYGFLPICNKRDLPEVLEIYQPLVDNIATDDGLYYRSLVERVGFGMKKENLEDKIEILEKMLKGGEDIGKCVYSIFSVICHKYIWCLGELGYRREIPWHLSLPWRWSADKLGLPYVLTHASVDLYNWSLKDAGKPISLDNLQSNYLMTGTEDEERFYLIMVAIEAIGGKFLKELFRMEEYLKAGKAEEIWRVLHLVKSSLTEINQVMKRMREKCRPEVFFRDLRPYLTGWNDAKKFPEGMLFEDNGKKYVLAGGSAAQSSLIQALDIFLSVDHSSTGADEFLLEMRKYMPGAHRCFLEDMEKQQWKLRTYLLDQRDNKMIDLFNQCLDKLKAFRSIHMSFVNDYVIKEAAKIDTEHGKKGSGGTDLNNFLKKPKDSTELAKIFL